MHPITSVHIHSTNCNHRQHYHHRVWRPGADPFQLSLQFKMSLLDTPVAITSPSPGYERPDIACFYFADTPVYL